MKKSINITLNSQAFILEEDGYEKLNRYLESIKRHYRDPEEEKEILADIEASIAEKFSEKISASKQVISSADVEEVIKVMGSVKEITEEGKEEEEHEKKIEKEEMGKKKLYRDPDDMVVAGVCSGIGAYFDIDPVFIRLLFVGLIFFHGFGILAYIVLWIVMPRAQTNAQKLEMRGKKINLAEIQQAVKEKSKMIGEEGKEAIQRLRQDKTWYKILNFPIRVIERIFFVLKKIFKAVVPTLSILIGLAIMLSSFAGMLFMTIMLSFALFHAGAPYIVSDFPLQELARNPFYYLAGVSVYFIIIIPLVLLFILGFSFLKRKNAFKLLTLGLLMGIWMVAIVTGIGAAGDLAPRIKEQAEKIKDEPTETKEYPYTDFHKLYLGGNQKITIRQGETYSIRLTGRPEDLERMMFNTEDGQLQITQKKRAEKGICLFCFDKEVTGEIIMPHLDSLVGVGKANIDLSGFPDDLYISMGEIAQAKIKLAGQNVKGNLSGVASKLSLSGEGKEISIKMNGGADLKGKDLKIREISVLVSGMARAELEGEAEKLEADISDTGYFDAFEFPVKEAQIRVSDISRANVSVREKLTAKSNGHARIIYKGNPLVEKEGTGTVEKSESEWLDQNDDEDNEPLTIKTDVQKYSPVMSSIRGIGLWTDKKYSEERFIRFKWATDQGYLVDNWDTISRVKEIAVDQGDKKIYWTFFSPDELNKNEQIHVWLEARDYKNELLDKTQIEMTVDKDGFVNCP